MLSTLKHNKAYKFSGGSFFCWFFIMILWLPTAIGGWLVYFYLLDAGYMWFGSLAISFFVGVYMGVREEGRVAD